MIDRKTKNAEMFRDTAVAVTRLAFGLPALLH